MEATSILLWAADELSSHFGRTADRLDDPLETLVLTILSQNTTDTNRDRAFASLIERFGNLDAVRTAPIADIAASIRVGGLHQQKARSIQAVLRRIFEERDGLDLSHLAALPLADALRWLLESPGVGPKTAGIVLLFAFDKPFFPVDTHIRRILIRLGLIRRSDDPHALVNEWLPADTGLMRRLHLDMIRLGREICRPKRPACNSCPLAARCDGRRESSDEHGN